MRRLLGLRDLVHDAIEKTTDLVQETHESVARKPIEVLTKVEPLGPAARTVDGVRKDIATLVFDSVRATNRSVQKLTDLGLQAAARAGLAALAAREDRERGKDHAVSTLPSKAITIVESAESALNAVMGDFLAARENALAVAMSLRRGGRDLPLDRDALRCAISSPTRKVCVFVHGLGCSDRVWCEEVAGEVESFGTKLDREAGFTSVWLRYNTGLHISENGRALAGLLAQFLAAYPCEVDEVALVGHSMGGLVARSAAHYGRAGGEAWAAKLTHVLCIGSPHLGAPLERAGHVVASVLRFFDTAGTQVPAKLINARSAGVKDLRYGYVLDEDWTDSDPDAFLRDSSRPAPFVEGVAYGYIAAHAHPQSDGIWSELLGDLLVQLPSASGHHPDEARRLPFHMGHVIPSVHHVALATHPAVYEQLKRFLNECRPPTLARDMLNTPQGSEP